jgi:hypothetical protein
VHKVIVLLTEKRNTIREASCCKVDVVNGAGDFLQAGFFFNSATFKGDPVFDSKFIGGFLRNERFE